MAIAHALTDTTGDIGSLTTTTAITKPAGAGSSHRLILVVADDTSTATANVLTPPAGWTRIGSTVSASGAQIRLNVFHAPGDVAGLTFTNSQTGTNYQQGWVCAAYTGVDATTPVDVTGTSNSNTGAATLATNGFTPASTGAAHLIAFCDWIGGTYSATGYTVSQNAHANAGAGLLYNLTALTGGVAEPGVTVNDSQPATGQVLAALPFALRLAGATPVPVVSLLTSNFVTTALANYPAPPTGTVAVAAGMLLVAFPAVTGSVATDWAVQDSVSGAGGWTKVRRQLKATSADVLEFWVRNALTTAGNYSFSYQHATGSGTGGGLVVLQVANMSRAGAAAVRSQGGQDNQASGTAPAPVMGQTTLTTNPTVTAVFDASTAGLTVPAGWAASDFNGGFTVPTAWLQVTHRNSGFAGTTITWGSNAGSAYCSLAIELDAGAAAVTGNASATLGALAGAAAVAVAVVGNAAATLGPLLGQAAASAGGGSTAAAAATFDPLTGSGSVTVRDPPTANAAATLGPLTGTAQAAVAVKGQAAAALGPLAGTASAVVAATGRAAATLAPLTGAAQAGVAVRGTASATLGALQGAASVTVPATATAAATLGPLTGQASAVVVSGRTASGQATLGPLAGAAAAAVAVRAQAAGVFDPLSGSASAAVAVRAQAAGTFEPLTGQAAATVPATAQGAAALGPLTGTATVLVSGGGAGVVGAAAGLLGPLSGAAAVRVSTPVRVDWHDRKRIGVVTWRLPS